MKAARELGLTLSQWDELSEDDRDWALAEAHQPTCPVCGSYDPEGVCQNPRYQHAWVVKTKRCYKTRAVMMHMKRFEKDPYAATVVPIVELDESRAKPE